MKHPLLLHYGIKITESKNNDNTKEHYHADYSDFISGLLTAFLLLDDNHLSFFRAQQNQRKHYVERTLQLQKNDRGEKTNCLP